MIRRPDHAEQIASLQRRIEARKREKRSYSDLQARLIEVRRKQLVAEEKAERRKVAS